MNRDNGKPIDKGDSHALLMAQAEVWLVEVHNLLSGCASKTDGDPIAFRLAAMEVRNAIGQLRSRADSDAVRARSNKAEGKP